MDDRTAVEYVLFFAFCFPKEDERWYRTIDKLNRVKLEGQITSTIQTHSTKLYFVASITNNKNMKEIIREQKHKKDHRLQKHENDHTIEKHLKVNNSNFTSPLKNIYRYFS